MIFSGTFAFRQNDEVSKIRDSETATHQLMAWRGFQYFLKENNQLKSDNAQNGCGEQETNKRRQVMNNLFHWLESLKMVYEKDTLETLFLDFMRLIPAF